MDTITHGILGAATSQVILGKRLPRGAALIGAIAGMLPDIDIILRSSTDPTVAWYYHRSFTHSLIFLPIGGLIAALPFLWRKFYREQKKFVILAALIGYLTHELLDTATSYGTQLFVPFSNYRAALDWIAIVDPVYSVILLVGVILSYKRWNAAPAKWALIFSTLYFCFGIWQHHRAHHIQEEIALRRGHIIERSRVLPMPLSLVLWRSIYISNGQLYADGIRVPYIGSSMVLNGDSATLMSNKNLIDEVNGNMESERQMKIFDWFTDGYIAPVHNESGVMGDMRFSARMEGFQPLWGVKIDPNNRNIELWSSSIFSRSLSGYLRDIIFAGEGYKTLQ